MDPYLDSSQTSPFAAILAGHVRRDWWADWVRALRADARLCSEAGVNE